MRADRAVGGGQRSPALAAVELVRRPRPRLGLRPGGHRPPAAVRAGRPRHRRCTPPSGTVRLLVVGGRLLPPGRSASAVVGPWRPQPVPPPVRGFRIVAANVSSANPTVDRAVADALAQGGDLVLLIEAGRGRWTPPPEYPTVLRPDLQHPGVPVPLPGPAARPPEGLAQTAPGPPSRSRRPRRPGRRLRRPPRAPPPRTPGDRPDPQPDDRPSAGSATPSWRRPGPETAPVVLAGDFNTSDRSRRLPADHRPVPRRRPQPAGPGRRTWPAVAAPPPADRLRLRAPGLVLGRSRAVRPPRLRPPRGGGGRRPLPGPLK